jgi:hypothetical protein
MDDSLQAKLAEIINSGEQNIGAKLLDAYVQHEATTDAYPRNGLPELDDSRYTAEKIKELQKPALQI